MRMLYWPLRSPSSDSKRFPGRAARSRREVAASRRSSFRRAERSMAAKGLTRFPSAKSLVRLSRKLTITVRAYQKVRITYSITFLAGRVRVEDAQCGVACNRIYSGITPDTKTPILPRRNGGKDGRCDLLTGARALRCVATYSGLRCR